MKTSFALLAALMVAMALSLLAGKVWLPAAAWTPDDLRWLIIAELRLPRTVLAAVVGAGLGLSGAAMQGYLRNPLADPGLLALTARSLDALTLGEPAARSMGVDPLRLQVLIVVGVGLCVGASVAAAGIIGFVGLMVPHLVRPFVGNRPSAVLLPAATGGALLLVVADSLERAAPTVSELRLGIAMSMLGGPFFFALLLRLRRQLP